jgi:tetratricopeptide (TPR) repeat protein
LLDGYEKIGKRANIPIAPGSKPVTVAQQVLLWLKRTPNWLLIVDNLDDINVLDTQNLGDPNIIHLLLPEPGPGQHTLITTRNPNADHIPAQAKEVPLFKEADSVALLSSLSGIPILPDSEQEKAAQQIVKELGNLPLAISQAGAYIKQKSGGFTPYLEHYTRYRSRVNSWIPKGPQSYPHSVATTWIMSFNEIRKNSTAAHLFQLLAFFNPDGILIEFLKFGCKGMNSDLERLVLDEFEFTEALLSFESFSLIKWDRQINNIVIHRLVQEVVRDEMLETDLAMVRPMTVDICNQAFPEVWDHNNWALCRLYIGQVMVPLVNLDVPKTVKSAAVMYRVGWFLRDDGKIIDSEHLLVRSREIYLMILGVEHPDTLRSMINLANTYLYQGRMTEAVELQEEVLEKQRWILGVEHRDTLTSMNNLALTCWNQGRTAEAAALQEEVLEKQKRILGAEHPDMLRSMNNLANMYSDQGRMADGVALQEVLEKRKRILGAEHPDTLISMSNLANMYSDQGRTAEAAALEEEVLEQQKRILGAEHPNTLRSMNNLSNRYSDQGRTADAAALREEVLEKRKQILGAEHPDTLISMSNLANTYSDQGRTAEAAALEEEVLEKQKQILGVEHPDTLSSMNNLAIIYSHQGRKAEAAALQEEVLEKQKRILGAEHPDTLISMSNLANTYSDQGRTAEAVTLQEEVLEKQKRILGVEHPDTLTSVNNLAITYSNQGRMAEAAALQEEVLEKRKRILGAEHPDTLISMSNLANTYSDQGRMAEAAALQEEVLENRG